MKHFIPGLLMLPLIGACQAETAAPSQNPLSQEASPMVKNTADTAQMHFTAEVVFKDLEGGFYALIAKDGTKYQPLSLAAEFRRHGLIVEVTAEKVTDRVTYQQFGTLIKVVNLNVIDASAVRAAGNTH